MNERRRSFLIRDILADVNVGDCQARDDEPPTTTTLSPYEFSDRGICPAVIYTQGDSDVISSYHIYASCFLP